MIYLDTIEASDTGPTPIAGDIGSTGHASVRLLIKALLH